ncbi:MAG TPA: oligosaccharide flippase family protein, partial [Mariprofundaceae bacterium]|nr:oligosaccharide flippase family protein [Mariprofundaceae bacterium]
MMHRLFRDSTALFLSQIVANIAAFLMAWAIARGMGDAQYGIFAAAYALATALASVADSGVRLALIREVARQPGHWRRLLRYAVIVSFCLGALLAVSAVLAIVLREGFSDVQRLRIVLLGFALLWVEMRILSGVLSGRGMFVPVGVWTAAERLGGALIAGASVFVFHAGLVWLATGLCVWESVVVLALWRWMFRQGWPAADAVDLSAWRFFRLAIPFGLAGIAGGVLARLDLIMLGFQQPPRAVGYYAAGQTLSLLALFAVIALSSAMYPSLTEMARDGRDEDARGLLMPALGTSMLLILSFASVLIAGAPRWLGWVYGGPFAAGAPWLALFAIAAVFPTLGSLFGSVVSAWGWQARWAKVVAVTLALAAPLFWL